VLYRLLLLLLLLMLLLLVPVLAFGANAHVEERRLRAANTVIFIVSVFIGLFLYAVYCMLLIFSLVLISVD